MRYVQICIFIALLLPAAVQSNEYADDNTGSAESEIFSPNENDIEDSQDTFDGSETGTMGGPTTESGETNMFEHIMPLDSIAAKTQELTDGQILDAEIKSHQDELWYELKVLESDERLRRYYFDAQNGRLIGVK